VIPIRSSVLALTPEVCDDVDAGTREGVILVSKAPPKPVSRANGSGANGRGDATRSDDGGTRRAELADFLRTRREALRPEDVGLPGGGRRRTPGLRREEVAQLAGVGTTWYTWLEQARDVRASVSVLEALAAALDLTPAERSHLILLGRGEQTAPERGPAETLEPELVRLIENLGPNPACIIGRRWDMLAWNRGYLAVFGDPPALSDGRRNLIWNLFMDPGLRKLLTDWERGSRSAVARFRSDSARHVGDPDFEALIDALREGSRAFRERWERHEVATSGIGRKVLRHPTAGKLVFEHAVFKLEETPERRLILYSSLPNDDTARKMERLLGG
jgi:transcriptional regulator with XRE-family HTH domain